MLTDIFGRRYRDYPIWSDYTASESGLLVQCLEVAKDVLPYYSADGQVIDSRKLKWKLIHDRLARELGVGELWPRYFQYTTKNWQGVDVPATHANEWVAMCEMFATFTYQQQIHSNIDRYMKDRISLIELAMRERQNEIKEMNRILEQQVREAVLLAQQPTRRGVIRIPGSPETALRTTNATMNAAFNASVEELNVRFQQSGVPLSYHNGFIQVATDEQIEKRISKPFWTVIADAKWQNVATDMHEALDRRDRGAGDAAWYACKALESAIKIISDQKGWTRGTEKGAHNYIDNLVAERAGVRYIDTFEMEVLKPYFSHVRNRFGHGPGSDPMPAFTAAQTDWAVEFAMTWVRTLVRRG
ncbi:AbiJ-NTD4 domain-containing protein [Burkholderia sp. L27(2015)]|uniref:AbiJ-NTD4 domain-containing protein n=1 Tax=Burkholderia sp. L27(2015) TaxID=1641858 RepID=UPI00131DD591|nr:hypothetical protein [Burkholderia sp. L27(2015)]